MEALPISAADKAAFFAGNAERVFGIAPGPVVTQGQI